MKWMGWNWSEYLNTPQSVVDEVVALIIKEAQAIEDIRSRSS